MTEDERASDDWLIAFDISGSVEPAEREAALHRIWDRWHRQEHGAGAGQQAQIARDVATLRRRSAR